jgi:diaminohydroxyphosphoribosylaminopyrimidine deaminase/5-amino-6-(5-phosphoribosylamino)uracil reductase
VALKLAMTLDGGIASAPGVTTRITGPEAEAEVHRLRSGFDALMVGAGTVRADAPRLTVRLGDPGHRPTHRIVLLPDARLPDGAPVAEGVAESPLHVFCRDDASEVDRASVVERGGEVHAVPSSERGVDLGSVLDACGDLGIDSIMCEGGSALAASLLAERLVDRCYLFLAPDLLGPDAVRAFEEGLDPKALADLVPFGPARSFGRDVLIVYDVVGGVA